LLFVASPLSGAEAEDELSSDTQRYGCTWASFHWPTKVTWSNTNNRRRSRCTLNWRIWRSRSISKHRKENRSQLSGCCPFN